MDELILNRKAMENPFNDKIEDFTGWCETAFIHYKNGYYADSLTNMRKSGEAACKLMVIYKYNEKTAENKIAEKSYKELIQLVIKEDLAQRSVINWLEALQIHGNMATHDKKIAQEQAHYSITALSLLIQWMFGECLKIQIPSRLKKVMISISAPAEQKNNDKQFEQELSKVRKDKEELEKHLHSLKGKNEDEKLTIEKLNQELEKSNLRIKEFEAAQVQAQLLETESANTKRESEEGKQRQAETLSNQKKNTVFKRKLVLGFLLFLFGACGVWLLFKNVSFKSDPIVKSAVVNVPNDTFNVLILPLTILQDNPNIKIKFEESLERKLGQRVQDKKMRMHVFYNPNFNKSSISAEDAISEGLKEKADLVIYGELYEPSGADSIQVNLRYALTRKDNRINGETGVQSFSKLTDSAAIIIQQRIETVVDLALAESYMTKNKYSDALALLYETKALSEWAKGSLYNFTAECHVALKNYPAAIKEISKLIEMEPQGGYAYSFMANVLKAQGDYAQAENNYQKSLHFEPNNVNTLLNYADLLYSKQLYKPEKSKELVLEALKYDSTHIAAWQFLSDLEYALMDYKAARNGYIKVLQLDPNNSSSKKSLAQILAFQFKEPEKAVNYLSSILVRDSADGGALFILANIYTSTSLSDPVKAAYLFKKSKQYTPTLAVQTDYALGTIAFNKQDFKTAEGLFVKAYAIDSFNLLLCQQLSEVYVNLAQYKNGLRFLERAYKLDTMNFSNNYNLGFFYYLENNYNRDKAQFYFERALKTIPDDMLSLEYLGSIYYDKGELDKAKQVFTKLYSLNSQNYAANKILGIFMERELNYEKALSYYMQAIKMQPDDWDLNSKLAYVMMQVSRKKYLQDALYYSQHAIKLNPNNADIMYTYSQILILAKDYNKAHDYYKKAISIKPSLKDATMEKVLSNKVL